MAKSCSRQRKKEYDIEIQRADAGAGAKRARHNSSLLDAHILKSGEEPEDMPESYVIFITGHDVMGKGKFYIVNGEYRGNDAIGKLMHDFSCENPDDMNFEELAKKARYFKRDEKGVAAMCKMMEDMRNEAAKLAELNKAKKTAIRMIKAGKMTLEDIADYTELSLEAVRELEKQSMQFA